MRIRLKRYFIGLFISCCLAGFAFNAQAQVAGANEWKRYELGKGNFSVLFPGQPKEEFKPSTSDAQIPIDMWVSLLDTEEGSFVAQYCVLGEAAEKWAESTKEHFYTGFWNGASDNFDKQMEAAKLSFRTKLEEKGEIKFSGYTGREMVFSLGPLRGRIWMTIVGRQAFAAMVLGSEKVTDEDRQKFLNSFTVTLQPIPVEPTKADN